MKKFFNTNKTNPWFWAFLCLAVILFFAMPIMSHSAGNSGDEDGFQIPQGENVLNYYATDGQDTSCMSFENLKYYGCSFDVITAKWNRVFHVDDIARTRHTANALCGWLVVLFAGLIAYRIGGWRAGVLAMVLMFLSPRFLGHSFNNPKDIPFATGVTMSIYYMLMFFRQAPRPKWSTMVMLTLSMAFAISIRVGGLILFGYFGLWGLLWIVFSNNRKNTAALVGKGQHLFNGTSLFHTVLWALAICLAGFLMSLLLWPYAAQSPIANTIDSFHAMSKFAIGIRQIYGGQMMWSDALPWYYTPKFIFTTTPIAIIIGWLLYSFTGAWCKGWPDGSSDNTDFEDKNKDTGKNSKHGVQENKRGILRFRDNRMESFMLYFTFVFPVIWIVYTKANVYGGWRHSLFAYPPMVATAALGFNGLVRQAEAMGRRNESKTTLGKWLAICATLLPFAMMIGPTAHIVRNHPYEYVYFNKLAGGTKSAFGKYEMDYYYHSMREATEWVIANAKPSPLQTSDTIRIGTWHINSTRYFLRHQDKMKPRFIRWYSRGDYDWDYAVFPLTGIDPAYLTNPKVFPPKETVHEITVDGVPIAIVLKRADKSDYYANKLKKAGLLDSALVLYHKALAVNPYNETALIDMAEIFLQKNMPDSSLWACQRFFEIEPDNDNARYFAAYSYLMKGDINSAISTLESVIEHNFKYISAYQMLASIYAQQGNSFGAENVILKAIDADQANQPLMQLFMQLKQAQGLDQNQAAKAFYSAMAKSLRKRGKVAEAEIYESYL